jgi:hypothetical protein
MMRRARVVVGASGWPLILAITAILGTFTVVPLVLSFLDPSTPDNFMAVAGLSALASVGMVVGYKLPMFARTSLPQRPVDLQSFQWAARGIFLGYVVVLCVLAATANSIPLLGALMGAAIDEVSESREQFLKARSGWAISFVYLHAILAGSLVPYAIAGYFAHRLCGRFVALAGFLFGCVLFAEKAFFLKAIIPIGAVAWRRGRWAHILAMAAATTACLMLLAVITMRKMPGTVSGDQSLTPSEYFSSTHAAQMATSPTDFMLWRTIAVPLFTTADSLSTFSEVYGSRYFLGATSSLVAGISGQERVQFERSVFEFEWGQNATGTGSANSIFFIEAFVNFGIPGVVAFSIIAGACLGFLARSPDPALTALWPLYLFAIYCGGLIGTLFSNGFVAVAIVSLFVRCPKGVRGTGR